MFDKLLAFLKELGDHVLAFASELASSIATNGGAVLMAAALAEVKAAEEAAAAGLAAGTKTAGVDKFKAAQAGVIKQLQDQGIPVVINAVNGAIEAAVANLRAAQVAGTVTQQGSVTNAMAAEEAGQASS